MSQLGSKLEVLNAEVESCRKCPRLVEWREEVARKKRRAYINEDYWGKPVTGFGDPEADLLIVGLAPGAHGANRTGRVFTGDRSGDWLYGALHRAGFANQPTSEHAADGLRLLNCYISMPVRCVPPQNKPTSDERANCATYLERELELLSPKVILSLGSIAFTAVQQHLSVSPRIKFGHGLFVQPEGQSLTLATCYHVSQQNTQTGKLTEEMLDSVFVQINEILG